MINAKRLLLAAPILVLAAWLLWGRGPPVPPVRIGALHSLSGTMALSERPLVDALSLAVDEINAEGGLLGRRLELIVVDSRSEPATAAREAERLIREQRVSALFACWTSACRKAVKPVVERHDHLMFYPLQYEGLEQSPNIIYTGATANQQIIPGTAWALERFGRKVYLVGSDYVFPRTANRIVRDLVEVGGGNVLGERYLPLGATNMTAVVNDIRRLKPDLVINTINGDSNLQLFRALREAGLQDQPMLSFSVAETELANADAAALTAHFGVWSYFQRLENPKNRNFVSAMRAQGNPVVSDPMESTYDGLRLWAQAVRDAGTSEPAFVNLAILRQTFGAPSGVVAVDAATRHLWKMVRIGQSQPDGQFKVLHSSSWPVRPTPFPVYRSRQEWERIANAMSQDATATSANPAHAVAP
ncbi:MAG: urea ABC transporter substrate-binding protein [Halochromatium sp.]|nr:urea ABC transporter substrate-binding protein [Halochromatium sp.]